jgi:HEAT repeat protein
LGLLGDPRAVPTLLDALGSRDTRVVEVAAGSLETLLGHREEMDGSGGRQRWIHWWEAASSRFNEGQRYRDGRLFDPGLLISRMEHPDAWVRRTAYDELVITTGQQLPFDTDGPWRVQQGHLRAWRRWWSATRSRAASGRWFLDGKPVL